jgi:hypothetical protein
MAKSRGVPFVARHVLGPSLTLQQSTRGLGGLPLPFLLRVSVGPGCLGGIVPETGSHHD